MWDPKDSNRCLRDTAHDAYKRRRGASVVWPSRRSDMDGSLEPLGLHAREPLHVVCEHLPPARSEQRYLVAGHDEIPGSQAGNNRDSRSTEAHYRAREELVRTILFSALALGALTSVAMAEQPLVLTDKQMDGITAGAGYVISLRSQTGGGWDAVYAHNPGPSVTPKEARAMGVSTAESLFPGQDYRIRVFRSE